MLCKFASESMIKYIEKINKANKQNSTNKAGKQKVSEYNIWLCCGGMYLVIIL